ncbi:MAG: DNA polymerase III subunit chi [Micavibrio sp.]|nr:MAG: DNA polymerase III subunit chi [Micavibrio sp.]
MTEIRFYHLERQSQDQVLPTLLAKALDGGHRIVVKTADDSQTQRLNEYLWTYNPDSFLPHGSKKDGNAELQPIWLSSKDENPNNADVLIVTQGSNTAMSGDFSLCCEMLDGHDGEAIKAARGRWKEYKTAGHSVTYWQQGERGWEEKG